MTSTAIVRLDEYRTRPITRPRPRLSEISNEQVLISAQAALACTFAAFALGLIVAHRFWDVSQE